MIQLKVLMITTGKGLKCGGGDLLKKKTNAAKLSKSRIEDTFLLFLPLCESWLNDL